MTKRKEAPVKRPAKPSADDSAGSRTAPKPEFPFELAATGRVVKFYNADETPRTDEPTERAAATKWTAFERQGEFLRVTRFAQTGEGGPEYWVKEADVEKGD